MALVYRTVIEIALRHLNARSRRDGQAANDRNAKERAMQIPLKIAFQDGLGMSDALRARIEREAQKLEQFSSKIVACRVTIGRLSGRHRHGDLYQVRLQMTLPGREEVVIDRNPADDHAHEDAFVAVRDVFNAARRRLQDHERRLSPRQGKVHEAPPEARVSRLFPEEGYGFITTADGRDVYFHHNAVLNDGFAKMRPGSLVRFAEEEGDKGPQASTVRLIRGGRAPAA